MSGQGAYAGMTDEAMAALKPTQPNMFQRMGDMDMKGPLANMALGMFQQSMAPKAPMQAPQHMLGLQAPQIQQRGAALYQPTPVGRLYG